MEKQKEKVKLKDTIKVLKQTWPYAKKAKGYIIAYAIIMIILIGLNVIAPLLSAKLILNITDGLLNKVIIIAGLVFFLESLRAIFDFFGSIIINKSYFKILNYVQIDLASETLNLDIKEIGKHSSGVFIDRLTKDAGE